MNFRMREMRKTEIVLYITAVLAFITKMMDHYILDIKNPQLPIMRYFVFYGPILFIMIIVMLVGAVALMKRDYPRKKGVKIGIAMNAVVYLIILMR